MKTLRITKGEETYTLTYGNDDPQYDLDLRTFASKGWTVEQVQEVTR